MKNWRIYFSYSAVGGPGCYSNMLGVYCSTLYCADQFNVYFMFKSKVLLCHLGMYTHMQNIELQVQMDNLKKELEEKDKLLMQAK